MHFHFGRYRLDPDRFELLRDDVQLAVEPQVFQILLLLLRNRDRMVSKDEIVEVVWDGRAISDESISSRISLARKTIGDDGQRQQQIRTVHGRGFRFVGDVAEEPDQSPSPAPALPVAPAKVPLTQGRKPSIAILPLHALDLPPERRVIADAISHDLIQAMSRLRWLAVFARGSTFRFRGPEPDLPGIGSSLGPRYVLAGMVEAPAHTLAANLELIDTQSGAVIWADRLTAHADDIQELRARIVTQLIAALEVYIPLNEAMAAKLGVSEHLDAWSSYHLGLHHMYRFTAADNARASALFEQAVTLDPKFARAYAGLSFTFFQDAFLRYGSAPEAAAATARRHAERGLELDALDPFVNLTMGRSFWLTDEPSAAAAWLDRATALNPNYAQAFYSRAFTAMLVGDHEAVADGIDAAISLSPLDPLLYGMLGVRALALVQAGQHGQAADWADRAATAPGAHFLIAMIAFIANSLAEREEQAQYWLAKVRQRRPGASGRHFFAAFPLHDPAARRLIESEIRKRGL